MAEQSHIVPVKVVGKLPCDRGWIELLLQDRSTPVLTLPVAGADSASFGRAVRASLRGLC